MGADSPVRPPSFDPELNRVEPSEYHQASPSQFAPRELAHRHIIESGPMTLTVGSILEGRAKLGRNAPMARIAGVGAAAPTKLPEGGWKVT